MFLFSVFGSPKVYDIVAVGIFTTLSLLCLLSFWLSADLSFGANNGYQPMAATALAVNILLVVILWIPLGFAFRKFNRFIDSGGSKPCS
ncbi:hypothetical protein [Oceaniglobus roseus]|uniref:hypothetical protein n=1 Tax=Oceaniglobus roseus TaxID=1737570 RepID=UPI0013001679|nr:hypothetical protein [Kandeliimicrobium roseum]